MDVWREVDRHSQALRTSAGTSKLTKSNGRAGTATTARQFRP
jgi:hypothetical protein